MVLSFPSKFHILFSNLPFIAIAVDYAFSISASKDTIGYIGQVNALLCISIWMQGPFGSVIVESDIAVDLPSDATHSIARDTTSEIKVSICWDEKRVARL